MITPDFKWNQAVRANALSCFETLKAHSPDLPLYVVRGRYTSGYIEIHEARAPLLGPFDDPTKWVVDDNSINIKLKTHPRAWTEEVLMSAMTQLVNSTEITKLEGDWVFDVTNGRFWFRGIMIIELSQPFNSPVFST